MCNLCILKTIRYINCSLPTYKRTQEPPFPLWHHTGRAAPMQVRLTCSFSSTVLVVVVAVGHFIVTYNFYILRIGHCCYGALATFAFAQTHTHRETENFCQFYAEWPEMPTMPPNLMRVGFGLESSRSSRSPLWDWHCAQLDKSNKFSCPTVRRGAGSWTRWHLMCVYHAVWCEEWATLSLSLSLSCSAT